MIFYLVSSYSSSESCTKYCDSFSWILSSLSEYWFIVSICRCIDSSFFFFSIFCPRPTRLKIFFPPSPPPKAGKLFCGWSWSSWEKLLSMPDSLWSRCLLDRVEPKPLFIKAESFLLSPPCSFSFRSFSSCFYWAICSLTFSTMFRLSFELISIFFMSKPFAPTSYYSFPHERPPAFFLGDLLGDLSPPDPIPLLSPMLLKFRRGIIPRFALFGDSSFTLGVFDSLPILILMPPWLSSTIDLLAFTYFMLLLFFLGLAASSGSSLLSPLTSLSSPLIAIYTFFFTRC